MVVEADSGAVQPESAEIKDVVLGRQIVDLPLKTREFLDLAMFSQGWCGRPAELAATPCSRPARW